MRSHNVSQRRRSDLLALFLVLGCGGGWTWAADNLVTREYWLKSTDAAPMIQALNIVIRNPTGKRILGGQGKHLVVTDAPEQQGRITEILPIMDQPCTQTKPSRIVMELVGRAGTYMYQNKETAASMRRNGGGGAGIAAPAAAIVSGTNSYDTFKSSSSIYAEEDAKLIRQPRRIVDEPVLPSVSDLQLKGVIQSASGAQLALLDYAGKLFTARDGGLFEGNKFRVKGVASQVFKEEVVITGPDRIPRHIKFKSTL